MISQIMMFDYTENQNFGKLAFEGMGDAAHMREPEKRRYNGHKAIIQHIRTIALQWKVC
jgi:hypothetical protein